MDNENEWINEKFWIEVEKNQLYPPKALTEIEGAKELTKNEDYKALKVLDNGCGTGWFGKMLQDKGADLIGTDISDTLIEEASKHIKTKKASSYNLPFDNESFDYVIYFMVAQVLEFPEQAFNEIHRVLKPEGKLHLGLVHPKAEKWDEKSGLCFQDLSTYHNIERRPWVFNLTDGRRFTKHYIHRPMSYYENELSKFFSIGVKLEPKFPEEMTANGKYARTEYLFMNLIKK